MNVLAFLLSQLLCLLAGAGLLSFGATKHRTNLVEYLAFSFVIGAGFVSGTVFLLGTVLQIGPAHGIVSALAVVLGVFGVIHYWKADWEPVVQAKWLLLLLVLQAILVGWFAGRQSLGGDGLMNFEFRGSLAVAHQGHIPLSYFSDASRLWMHFRYPLYLPLNEYWIYAAVGHLDQTAVKWLTISFTLAASGLIAGGFQRLGWDPRRGWLACVLFSLTPRLFVLPGGAASLWADFPLGVIFLACTIELLAFLRQKQPRIGVLAFSLALLPWMKTEGVILGAVLVVLFGVTAFQRKEWKALLLAPWPMLFVVFGWRAFLFSVHYVPSDEFFPVTWHSVLDLSDRIPLVATEFLREMLTPKKWTLLWPMSVIAAVILSRSKERNVTLSLATLTFVPVALYAFVFLHTMWASPYAHLVSAMPRLLIPSAMIGAILIALGMTERDMRN